jgi:hypothetical protein
VRLSGRAWIPSILVCAGLLVLVQWRLQHHHVRAVVDQGPAPAPSGLEEGLDDAGAPDRDTFAAEMALAANAAVPGLSARYVDDGFLLEWQKGDSHGEYFLEGPYREYAKLPSASRAEYLRRRARTVPGPELPASLAEARPRIVAVVRERIGVEVARIYAAPDPLVSLPPAPPHVAVTDELWGLLAYETEDQFVRLDAAALGRWGVSFADLWPEAVTKLAARAPTSTRESGGLHELRFDDENESARLLVPATFASLPLQGDPVVASPRQDLLIVAGADDEEGLHALFERLRTEWDDGAQSLRVVRLQGGHVVPFDLEPSHPLHAELRDLQDTADQRDARLEGEALAARLDDAGDAPFVASVKRFSNVDGDEEVSFVVQTEGVPTLLPRADFVVFRGVDVEKKTATTLACAPWAKAIATMRERWKVLPLSPQRWLATDLPTKQELQRLGCPHPALRMGLGRAVSYE